MQQKRLYLIALISIVFFPLQAVIPLDTTGDDDSSHETNEVLEDLKRVDGPPVVDSSRILIAHISSETINPPVYVIINSSQDLIKLFKREVLRSIGVKFFSLDAAHKYIITEDGGRGSYIKRIFP